MGWSHQPQRPLAAPIQPMIRKSKSWRTSYTICSLRADRAAIFRAKNFSLFRLMSWFHLTVDSVPDLPIVRDLRAQGTSPEQRLFKIAQIVGLPAHGLSRSYFEIADAISAVLIAIETGSLHVSGAAPAFYDPAAAAPGFPGNLANTMNTIITHWSLITGRDMKAGKVAST